MDTEQGTIWGREPAVVLAVVQAVIALVVAFGLSLALDQIGAILAVTAVSAPAAVARWPQAANSHCSSRVSDVDRTAYFHLRTGSLHSPTRFRGALPKGDPMPKIVVTAAVKDVQAWLEFKPLLIAALSGVASDGSSYVAADGSNQVASTWDVPDMDTFMAAQAKLPPEVAAMSERAGMIPPVVVYVKK